MSNKNKKKAYPDEVHDIPIDSVGEMYFVYYFQELKEAGYIKDFKRGQSYLLSDSLLNNYAVQLKTKSKPMSEVVLMGHSYNLDFEVEWTEEGARIFCSKFGKKITKVFICNDNNISYIEGKPFFDSQNMSRLAVLNIKWLYQKYGIFCQICIPEKIFPKTFTPTVLRKTKTGKDRKINWHLKTLEEFTKL